MRFLVIFVIFIAIVTGCKTEKESEKSKTTGSANELLFTAPDSWIKEMPDSRMRRAQYKWPGVEGTADAECAVYVFPGTGGSVQDNLNRWYGQFKQPGDKSTEEIAEVKKRTVNNLPVTVVYLTGTYLKSMAQMTSGTDEEVPNSAMLAAIIETPHDPWFFKAVGPVQTIDHWRASFDEFVSSIKYVSD
jgi:hypothetical protein